MSNRDLINHTKRTIFSYGFVRSGILQILAWPLLCLILATGLWYWTILKINAEKQACEKKVIEEASALCKDYAQYLAQAIEQANQITLQVQYGWEQSHGNLDLQELSQGGIFRNPRIVNVIVVNREGMLATTNLSNRLDVSYSDRDYFVYHKNDDSKALLIGKPLVSRLTGKPIITFSRRLNAPQGAFDGVALVAYDPHYLTAFYAGSFPGKTGVLMVAGLDGTLRSATIGGATQDPMPAALRAVPLFNSPEGASYLSGERWFGDKQSRYVAWKTLEEYPLVAMVGLSEQEYFAPYQKAWATDRGVAISGSIILFLFALAAAGMSTRLVRKKHQEEEVRKAYRIATEGGNEGFYMFETLCDKSGAIVDFVLVDCNERGAGFYGIPQMQLMQMKLSGLYPTAYFDELMNIFRGAMASGFYEDEIKTPRESKLQIEWTKRRLVRSGNGLAVTVQDISERKRAEEALLQSEEAVRMRERMLNESQRVGQVGGWDWDAVNDVIWWSDVYYRIFGVEPGTPPPNYPDHLRFYMPESAERLDSAVKRAMELGEPYELDLELAAPTPTTHWIMARCEVKRDANGAIVGLRGTAHNITERKRAEEEIRRLNEELEQRVVERTIDAEKKSSELKESQFALMNIVEDLNLKTEDLERLNKSLQDEIIQRVAAEEQASWLNDDLVRQKLALEAANRELEAFSYSVSHDLRAPLRALDGFSQAVLEDYGEKLGDEGRDYLQRMRAASQRMGQLIDDILNLSRLARYEMLIEDVDLSGLVRTVAGELQGVYPDRRVEVVVADGIRARGDARLLRVAFENLLGNAWKFTGGNPEARIEFGSVQEEDNPAYFIRDNGVGFDMDYADKLFMPFQRLHAANEFPGTGIGLATVQRIINRHKGRIWAESEIGKGSTFYFTL